MDANGIIGREYEQKLILERCKSNKAELIAIYGRRRVGKTFLVRKIFNDQFAFSFIGMYEVSRAVQLEQFRMALAQYAKQTVPKLKTWFEAFAALREYLSGLSQQEPIVLFFDELPWMDTPKSNFIAAFSYFWNSWASMVPQLKLIVCGSSTTWMLAKFIGDKGGLYGRVTRQIYLAPFSLGETELFLNELKGLALTRQQVLDVYMILGGISFQFSQCSPQLRISSIIQCRSAVIQDQYLRLSHQSPCNRQTLSLSAGKILAVLGNLRIQLSVLPFHHFSCLRHFHNSIVNIGPLGCSLNFFFRCVDFTVSDILPNCSGK